MRPSRLLLGISIFPALASCSSGDRSPKFKQCVYKCTRAAGVSTLLPLLLTATGWTTEANCKYICMHQITDVDSQNGIPMQQYNGKWPFWRLAGMQEPASVAFSLLNLWAHVRGWLHVRKRLPDSHPLKKFYIVSSIVSMNAWVWSSVFHTRDTPITEKLDYFSAALAILYPLYATVVRLFHLYPPAQPTRLVLQTATAPPSRLAYQAWSLLCVIVYAAHIGYLTLSPRFDYTYNMAFNLVLGIIHNILWLIYSLPSRFSVLQRFPSRAKSHRPSFVTKAAIFVFLTTSAIGLELFDFPPVRRVIDAHSLWHLATAPISVFWYNFLIEDALDEGWREYKS